MIASLNALIALYDIEFVIELVHEDDGVRDRVGTFRR